MSAVPRPDWLAEFPKLAEVYDRWMARDVLSKADFDLLAKEMKGTAFSAAGTMTDVVRQRLLDTLGKALSEGMTVAQWQEATAGIFESDAYARLVFRTNITNAYDGARYGDMFGDLGQDYPAWRFNAVIDERNDEPDECPNQICRKLDGKVFLKSDVPARHLLPKVHWQCRCYASEVSADEAGGAIKASTLGLTAQDDWDFDKLSLAPKALSGGTT